MFKLAMTPFRFAAVAPFFLAAGCGAAPPTQSSAGPTLPRPQRNEEYQVRFPDPGHGVARYIRLTLSEELSKSCGLMRTYFELDSDTLSPQDKATLHAVAECLNRPELQGSDLSIVGRADARGSSAYNADLGLRRAEAVKKLLVDAGVNEGRIVASSAGDAGAVGGDKDKDAYSHGYDRRVDVLLLGVVHAPR
jgi:peptidoglycan-associated lipoprotein